MKRVSFLVLAFALSTPGPSPARDGKAEEKGLPATATWELRPFGILFRVVRTDYDEEKMQVRWTLETKEGMRTSDFVRLIDRDQPFTFTFLDEDDKELATVQLGAADYRGIPRDRVMKEGTRLEVTLDLPRAWPKTKKVILRRSRA
jgi:hypothetical protein